MLARDLIVPVTLALALAACGSGTKAGPPASSPGGGSAAARGAGGEGDGGGAAARGARDPKEFEIRESDTAKDARGVNPSKIKPSKTHAALRLFVVDKDKGPIEGLVIAVTDPDGTRYYTEETDALGYAEVLVPVGQTYTLTYLTLGRGKDFTAKATITDEPNQNIKLTLQYRREDLTAGSKGGAAPEAERRFVLHGVNFETDKATLTRDSYAKLDTVVEYMTHKRSARIEIAGHTDNVGKAARNKKLSEDRAKACRDYLVSKGIEPDRITTVGHGSELPIASNDTPDGRAQNRRIEVTEL